MKRKEVIIKILLYIFYFFHICKPLGIINTKPFSCTHTRIIINIVLSHDIIYMFKHKYKNIKSIIRHRQENLRSNVPLILHLFIYKQYNVQTFIVFSLFL